MKFAKGRRTTPVLLSKLSGLRCEKCSSTNLTIHSKRRLTRIIGTGKHLDGLSRGASDNGTLGKAYNVNRAH